LPFQSKHADDRGRGYISELRTGVSESNPDGKPVLDKYYYDEKTGMLFFNVIQDFPNPTGTNSAGAVATSPLGSCTGGANDPSCPDAKHFESYYACPAQGCVDYGVVLNDDSYTPGPSGCGDIYKDGKFVLKEPFNEHKLAYSDSGAEVVPIPMVSAQKFDHAVPETAPKCADRVPGT
jgi:hypothetical protein